MKSISGKQFAKILEANGWQLLRVKGSHHLYVKPDETIRISVPIHGNKDLKIGLLTHFMKLANLTEEDFK
ncbi:MAG: addiction module toxin, HicA family [Synechococcaceae cyanobacterium SM2_3_1]|nr:addiction module toxin, HicA family [Synechococcaceae cyanobacterium SM2_3_1]